MSLIKLQFRDLVRNFLTRPTSFFNINNVLWNMVKMDLKTKPRVLVELFGAIIYSYLRDFLYIGIVWIWKVYACCQYLPLEAFQYCWILSWDHYQIEMIFAVHFLFLLMQEASVPSQVGQVYSSWLELQILSARDYRFSVSF